MYYVNLLQMRNTQLSLKSRLDVQNEKHMIPTSPRKQPVPLCTVSCSCTIVKCISYWCEKVTVIWKPAVSQKDDKGYLVSWCNVTIWLAGSVVIWLCAMRTCRYNRRPFVYLRPAMPDVLVHRRGAIAPKQSGKLKSQCLKTAGVYKAGGGKQLWKLRGPVHPRIPQTIWLKAITAHRLCDLSLHLWYTVSASKPIAELICARRQQFTRGITTLTMPLRSLLFCYRCCCLIRLSVQLCSLHPLFSYSSRKGTPLHCQ